jgi:hypothetical protein
MTTPHSVLAPLCSVVRSRAPRRHEGIDAFTRIVLLVHRSG